MQPEARQRLIHVLDAGEKIIRITEGQTFTEYEANELLRLAVERLFSIIGEALREAGKVESPIAAEITAYRKIVDFRNILVHDYATVYDEGVWHIIVHHLPRLLGEVRALLASS